MERPSYVTSSILNELLKIMRIVQLRLNRCEPHVNENCKQRPLYKTLIRFVNAANCLVKPLKQLRTFYSY